MHFKAAFYSSWICVLSRFFFFQDDCQLNQLGCLKTLFTKKALLFKESSVVPAEILKILLYGFLIDD